jgi:Fe-S-cluster-containing dehydrogenase component
MHCKDPECLTGCPTGAIGRFDNGQVDITASACIGCGDCATNCPYDAISMVARRGSEPEHPSFGTRLRGLLRLSPEPLPAAVEQTEDLLAVKCNLCEGTSINPRGSARSAYSCEENCPTGALARVDPRSYFSEVGRIEGLLRIDHSHAIGRNIHRSDPKRTSIHVVGVLLTLLLTGGAIVLLQRHGLGEALFGFLNMRWLTALVGLAAIIGVMTYPIRRRIYTRRRGALRYWMLTHSYLGVIAAVMIFLHGGTDAGGLLTTALMLSFDATIVTGLFGIACYVLIPRLLTSIEGSPLLIDDLNSRRQELQNELGNLLRSAPPPLSLLMKKKVVGRFLSTSWLLQHKNE